MPEPSAPLTLLAFDFGLRRIGVAVGQDITGSASPIGIVDNSESGPDFERIDALVGEWRPTLIVVGMPSHADGSPTDLAEPIAAFIQELGRFELPIETTDERHSSQEAEQVLKHARRAGTRGRIKKAEIDAAAAVVIAERYMAGSEKYK